MRPHSYHKLALCKSFNYLLNSCVRSVQAAFRKFLSATKNKIKTAPQIKMNGGGAGTSLLEDDEEFEARKHEWQVQPRPSPLLSACFQVSRRCN